jgi:hypothetical protein
MKFLVLVMGMNAICFICILMGFGLAKILEAIP